MLRGLIYEHRQCQMICAHYSTSFLRKWTEDLFVSDISGCDIRNRHNKAGDIRQIAQYELTVNVWTMGCRAMVICGVNPSAIEELDTTPGPGLFPITDQAAAKASEKGLYGLNGHPMMAKMDGYASNLIN